MDVTVELATGAAAMLAALATPALSLFNTPHWWNLKPRWGRRIRIRNICSSTWDGSIAVITHGSDFVYSSEMHRFVPVEGDERRSVRDEMKGLLRRISSREVYDYHGIDQLERILSWIRFSIPALLTIDTCISDVTMTLAYCILTYMLFCVSSLNIAQQ